MTGKNAEDSTILIAHHSYTVNQDYRCAESADAGDVTISNKINPAMASSSESPHISNDGRSRTQTSGRSGWPKSLHRLSSVNCIQRMPAGFPIGMPGMNDEMDGAIQQAPQPARQSMALVYVFLSINPPTQSYRKLSSPRFDEKQNFSLALCQSDVIENTRSERQFVNH